MSLPVTFVSTTLYGQREYTTPPPLPSICSGDGIHSSTVDQIELLKYERNVFINKAKQEGLFDKIKIAEVITTKGLSSDEAPYIYERNGFNAGPVSETIVYGEDGSKTITKSYQNPFPLIIAQEWEPRIRMVDAAHQCKAIFALSIIPKNPQIMQTLYHKNSFDNQGEIAQKVAQAVSEEQKDITDTKVHPSISTSKDTPLTTAKKVTGFIKPFPTFASKDFIPEIDPKDIRASGPEDLEEEIVGYAAPTQDSIRKVMTAFLDDREATMIGLTILHQGRVRRLFFTKI